MLGLNDERDSLMLREWKVDICMECAGELGVRELRCCVLGETRKVSKSSGATLIRLGSSIL